MSAYLALRTGLWALVGAVFGASVSSNSLPASAQGSMPLAGGVSCFLLPAKLSDQAITQFMANPESLLALHPQGGVTLTNFVRTLAGSDVRTVDPLLELARNATPAIKTLIATGLANTAASCARTRPDIAQLINERVAASQDAELITVFLGVAGATERAVVHSAPAGAVGGGIGGTPAGSGSAIKPRAVPQGGGLLGFSVRSNVNTSNTGSTGKTSSGGTSDSRGATSTLSLSGTGGFDGVNDLVRSDSTVNVKSTRRLFAPESPVSQTVQ